MANSIAIKTPFTLAKHRMSVKLSLADFVRDDDDACSAGPLGGGTKARQQHDISRALTYWQEYKRRKKEAGNGIDT